MHIDGPSEDASNGDLTSCFGYSFRSTLPFPFASLRRGNGSPLHVIADSQAPDPNEGALLEWKEGGQSLVRLHTVGHTYVVWIDGVGWFRVDPRAPSIAVTSSATGPRLESRILGLPTALCFMHRGDFPIHAASVDIGGSALLLAAPGRFGKSTLASAFIQAGGRPLSEDTTCLRMTPVPSIVPGPAVMRIRPDVHLRIDFPGTRVVAEDPDRVYLAVDEARRGDDAPVPVRGVVFLRRSEGEINMERVPAENALPDLWTLSFHLPTDEDRARCFSMVAELGRQVPVWNLHRRLSFEHLPDVVDRIISTCLSE